MVVDCILIFAVFLTFNVQCLTVFPSPINKSFARVCVELVTYNCNAHIIRSLRT